jgi:hypothetical protein
MFIAVALLVCATATAQNNIAVESFTKEETSQDARIISSRKDQNDKVCAIVKIETPLLLQDFTFDAGMTAITHTEQKIGEIWLWLSPGTLRLTIQHKHLGTIRNYEFGESLKEATVYIMKLKSGSVKTVVEENIALQYIEMLCAVEGATVKIDEADPEPFTNGKFQKLLSYGKHKYTVEAPMHHPESGITEITVQKSTPISVVLKPKFGKLIINTQPEQDADVFIDEEKRGKSPLTIERIGSGQHKIRVVKSQFLPATKEITITDGTSESLTLNMPPNFAVITLTTPNGGDIYINDKKEADTRWSGRLTQGQYKVEVMKPSHRSSVKAIEVIAGGDKTIALEAPVPIYGSLNVTSGDINADVFIDEKKEGTTPEIINKILIGERKIELRADGHLPYTQTVNIHEGKIFELQAVLQKKGSLRITANITANVYINGKEAGNTPITANNLSSGRYKIELQAKGYKPYMQTVDIQNGKISEINATLQEKDEIGTLCITTNTHASVNIDGKHVGYTLTNTPLIANDLPLGKKKVSFYRTGYKRLTKTVTIVPGNNDLYGKLKKVIDADSILFFEYRIDPHSYLGLSLGYCKKVGGYAQVKSTFDFHVMAGLMLRITKFMYTYGGAGYGWDNDNDYELKEHGPEVEFGITFKIRKLAMTAGYTHRIMSRHISYTTDPYYPYISNHTISSYSYNDLSLKWKGVHFGLGYVWNL